MSGNVMIFDREGLAARRAAILADLGVTEDDLRERGRLYALTADELAALDELDDLDYLRDGLQSPA